MEYIPASSVEPDEIYESESLTVLQAARHAGVTQSAIIRWIRNGYLPATSSSNGWQIEASKLEEARAAADESRGTGPVPRQTGPRLVPAPADLRQSLVVQAQEHPGRLDVLGEAIVSPLVELIRDQGDVVHDQAEVIGWLQAERSRLTAQLSELKQQEQMAAREPAPAIADESTTSGDNHVDEVVSWLWNDTDRTFDSERQASQELATLSEPHQGVPSQSAARLAYQTGTTDDDTVASDEDVIVETDSTASQDPVEDLLDSIWATTAVLHESAQAAASPITFRTSPAPVLQPIIPRGGEDRNIDSETLIEAGDNVELQQMIDKTEAKIFNLWRAETDKEFQHSNDGTDSDDDAVDTRGTAFWQRVWPLKRWSS